jgi:hypothetical protein
MQRSSSVCWSWRAERGRRWAAGAIAVAAVALSAPAGALAGPGGADGFPSNAVGKQEVRDTRAFGISDAVRAAKPFSIKTLNGVEGAQQNQRNAGQPQRADGPIGKIEGAAPAAGAAKAQSSKLHSNGRPKARAAVGEAPTWPYSYASNPNRQIGKLYFDVAPGAAVDYRWCSATAINSENKSLVLTAGHCVYSPDPDGNGYITGNGYWYEGMFFCPGYENGCKLGAYYPRLTSTTWSWLQGSGSPRTYDWGDDIATVLVNPNSNGSLVDYTGGQGIMWNAPADLYRWAYGYPVTDSRWPAYSYSGQDMIYCPGNSWAVTANHLALSCTMTGGASGGPWLTNVNYSSWLGYVNGVNSHKPWGGAYMGSPYFGTTEGDLYNWARAR